MLRSIRQISLLNKLFNVHGSEWPRVGMAWLLSFLYRVGFVVGWTVIVGMFVAKYGIFSLPYLFVLNALFTILGSFLYSTVLGRFKDESIMVATLFLASALLLLAYYFSSIDQILFFALLIIAEAFFLVHFRIMFNGAIEERFTPIESERTFPLIESSETIGGIAAGVIVVLLASSINIPGFILIWTCITLLMIPCLFLYENMNKKITVISKSKEDSRPFGVFTKIKKELKNSSYFSYVKGLLLIVFFQWFLFNLMEFQYTKAVYQNVSHVVLDAGSGFEHAFVHDLGQLFILFSASALIIQLFIGSRLIKSLGIYGSMLLHPIVTLFSVFGLSLSFTFANAVLAKNNFTITSVIHLDAYHSAYYAIRENLRGYVRHILDGIVRPLGAVMGTMVLIALQKVFMGSGLIFSINLAMIAVCLAIFAVTYLQQERYTRVALKDLVTSTDKEVRFNAIDILAQKGHKSSIPILRKLLLDEKEPVSIRVRVLRAFSELKEMSVVKDIMKCFGSDRSVIRVSALDTLLSYKLLFKRRKKYTVLEHELIEVLKKLYRNEENEEVRSRVIELLSRMSSVSTFEFLLKVLKTSRGSLKADAIYALGNYEDESIIKYVRPYLKARNSKQRISAVIAIGRFKSCRDEILGIIAGLLNSRNNNKIADALFAIGELNLKNKKRICVKYAYSKNIKLKTYGAIALAKMGYEQSIPILVDLLFSGNEEVAGRVKKMLKNVHVRIHKNFDKIVRHLVTKEVEKIIPDNENESLENLNEKKLVTLKWLYCLAEEYDEVESINNILKI